MSNSNNPVLVATWGDPSQWSKVDYYCNENSESKNNFTDLVCYDNVEKLILIVLDSIITPDLKVPKEGENSSKTEAYNRTVDCMKESDILINEENKKVSIDVKSNNYKEWIDKATKYVKCVLQKSRPDLVEKTDVIVVPAMGTYGKYKFSLIPTEAVRCLLYLNLYDKLKDVENKQIILDLTHGVNYLGALTLIVVQRLAQITRKNLIVKNAIPKIPYKEYQLIDVAKFSKNVLEVETIDSNNVNEPMKYLIESMKYNAVLLIPYIYKKYKKSYDKLIDKIKEFNKSMKIEKKEDNIEIKLDDNKVLNGFKEDNIISWIIFDYIFKKIDALKLSDDELFSIGSLQKNIKNIVFNSEISKTVIENELNNIHVGLKNNFEELVKQAKKDNFKIPLYKFYKTKSDEVDKQDLEEMIKSIDQTKRNFIAHAGLLKELVIVDVKDLVDLNKNMEDFDKKITKAKLYYNNTDENFDKILEILNNIVQGIDNLWK